MAEDSIYADLLDSLSPVTKAGLDPDEASVDRAGTMKKLMGDDDAAPKANWFDQPAEEAQNNAPPQPGTSPNGNALPPGLNSRVQPQPPAPAAPPAVPGAVTPTGDPSAGAQRFQPASGGSTVGIPPADAQPSWADLQRRNVTSGMASLDKSDQNLQTMQDQPDLATTTKNLEQARQNAAQPIPAYDPQTGKLLSEYKPTFGQRFMRGVEGFAGGGVFGAVDPKIGGAQPYGAPNAQYGREVQQQGQRVLSLDQQIKNAGDNWKAASDRAKAQAAEQRANADARGKISTEITAQEGIPIRQQEADTGTAQAYNSSPEGKAEAAKELNAQTLSSRQAQLTDPKNPLSKASTADKAYFTATGKLPDPDRYHAPPEQVLFDQAHAAWVAQNPGKKPGLEDIRSMVEATKGGDKGTLMMVPDGKGGHVATMVHSGDAVPSGSTTAAGMGKAGADADKETKAAQSIVDEADLAHKAADEADNGNAEGDVDLMLAFFKTIKGSNGSGIRFTQQEQSLIRGARNSAGDLVAVGQKVIGSGQALTPKQRKDALRIIDLHAEQAKKHLGGGSSPTSMGGDAGGGGFKWADHPVVQ